MQAKSFTADGFIPPRLIYTEVQLAIADIIKKDRDSKRNFWTNTDFFGWKRLNKLELEEVPIAEGVHNRFVGAYKILRSKTKIPAIFRYQNGSVIRSVSSVTNGMFFEPTSPRQWNAISKRRYRDTAKNYYYEEDGFLFFPIPQTEGVIPYVVSVDAFFENPSEVDAMNEESGICCKGILDYEVPVPSYLLEIISQAVLQKLRNYYLSLPTDEYPNLNTNDKNNERDVR
jgi:hypothetical protein